MNLWIFCKFPLSIPCNNFCYITPLRIIFFIILFYVSTNTNIIVLRLIYFCNLSLCLWCTFYIFVFYVLEILIIRILDSIAISLFILFPWNRNSSWLSCYRVYANLLNINLNISLVCCLLICYLLICLNYNIWYGWIRRGSFWNIRITITCSLEKHCRSYN